MPQVRIAYLGENDGRRPTTASDSWSSEQSNGRAARVFFGQVRWANMGHPSRVLRLQLTLRLSIYRPSEPLVGHHQLAGHDGPGAGQHPQGGGGAHHAQAQHKGRQLDLVGRR